MVQPLWKTGEQLKINTNLPYDPAVPLHTKPAWKYSFLHNGQKAELAQIANGMLLNSRKK